MKGDFVVTRVGHYRQRAVSFGAADTYGSGPVTVRQLTDEERELLDKLLGPPRMPLPKNGKTFDSKAPALKRDEHKLNLPDTVYVPIFSSRRSQVYHVYEDCIEQMRRNKKTTKHGSKAIRLHDAREKGLRLCAFCKVRFVREEKEAAKRGL